MTIFSLGESLPARLLAFLLACFISANVLLDWESWGSKPANGSGVPKLIRIRTGWTPSSVQFERRNLKNKTGTLATSDALSACLFFLLY